MADEKTEAAVEETSAETSEEVSGGTEAEAPAEPQPGASAELEALRAQIESLRASNARLEGRLDERKAAPAEAPKTFTRTELQAQVDAGTLSEDQRDEILERQRDQRLRETLRAEIHAEESARRVNDEIQRYLEAIPGVGTPGHEAHARLQREYSNFLSLGLPDAPTTQIAALRATFGAPEQVRERTREVRERSRETATPASGASEGQAGADSWTKGLSSSQIEYQKKMLDRGYYSGTNDPRFKAYCERARKGKTRRAA